MKTLADDLKKRIQSVENEIWISNQGLSVNAKFLISTVVGVIVGLLLSEIGLFIGGLLAGYWIWLGLESNRKDALRANLASLKEQLESIEGDT